MRHCRTIALASLAVLLAGSPLLAQEPPTFSIIVQEGDEVPGVGDVTRIDNLAVNDLGEWLVEADTDFTNTDQDQVLIRNGMLYLREDQDLDQPPGARLDFLLR